jgi:alpha-ribazole phosphatase
MELMLVRHTEVGVPAGVVYGRTDVPLADTFADEFVNVHDRIRRFWPEGPTAIISSPATRTRMLTEHLIDATSFHKPAIFDERLLEIGFGAWEMSKWSELDRTAVDAWMADYVNVRPPAGELPAENLSDLAVRVGAAVDDAITLAADETSHSGTARVLVVCHGAVIRVALATLLHMPLSRSFSIEIDKGSVSRIGFRGTGSGRRPLILGVNYR